MPTRVHHQQHGDHLPRILGWDVAGRMAPTIVADYRRLVAIFGREPPGVPFTVYVEPGGERASYRRGAPTTFFVGAQGLWSAGLTAAAMVDVFVAAAGHGWEGGTTHGTAFTWALAVALHPELGPLLQGMAGGWWNHGAVDYLATNRTHAADPDATGCGVLFLCYLHNGLGQSWPAIVRAGGATLAATYAALTGQEAGYAYPTFRAALHPWIDRAGVLRLPVHGNPWHA
jgi:hypothetical protein